MSVCKYVLSVLVCVYVHVCMCVYVCVRVYVHVCVYKYLCEIYREINLCSKYLLQFSTCFIYHNGSRYLYLNKKILVSIA